MDFDDISPVAIGGGVVGLLLGLVMLKFWIAQGMAMTIFFKIALPVCTTLGGFFVTHFIASKD